MRPHYFASQTSRFSDASSNGSDTTKDDPHETNNSPCPEHQLYESNALPHLYTVGTRFTRVGASDKHILCPLASFFDEAFARFRAFFKQKTGLGWEDRLSKKKRAALEADGSLFRYLPPVLGRPRGVLMPGREADDDE